MKIKNVKNWDRVIFNDRAILPKDLTLLSKSQLEDFYNLEVKIVKEYEQINLYVKEC